MITSQENVKYLVLRIEIWQTLNFNQPLSSYLAVQSFFSFLKSLNPSILGLDLDNLSELSYIQLITELLDEIERFLVVFEVKEIGKIQNLMPLLEKIVSQSSKVTLILNGEHPILEKMLKPLGESKILRNLDIEKQEKIFQTWTKNLN